MQKTAQLLGDSVTPMKRPYEAIIRILTVVVAAAGGYIMFPKIFVSMETTKLAAVVLSSLGTALGFVFGALSYRRKRQSRREDE